IDVVLQTSGANAGEALLRMLVIEVSEIEIGHRIFGVADLKLVHNRARHYISWSEFSHRVVFGYKAVHLQVTQVRPLATQGLGEQKPRRVFQVQCRGMELDKLHVADLGASVERHGDTI